MSDSVLHKMTNPKRFAHLLILLGATHIDLDDETFVGNDPIVKDFINPVAVLPCLGLMKMLVCEMEEMLFTAIEHGQYPNEVNVWRETILSLGVSEPMLQSLLDATAMKHHRFTDERLEGLVNTMLAPVGVNPPPDPSRLSLLLLTQPEIKS